MESIWIEVKHYSTNEKCALIIFDNEKMQNKIELPDASFMIFKWYLSHKTIHPIKCYPQLRKWKTSARARSSGCLFTKHHPAVNPQAAVVCSLCC